MASLTKILDSAKPGFERYMTLRRDGKSRGEANAIAGTNFKAAKKDIFDKVGDFVGDVGKTLAYGAVAPINSVTGHVWRPKYATGVGKVVGATSNIGIDSLHIAGKTFADTITFGYASKAGNLVRKKENRESYGKYNEMKDHETGMKLIDKTFQKISKGGAAIIGSAVGVKALASGAKKLGIDPNNFAGSGGGSPQPLPGDDPLQAGSLGFGSFPLLVIGAIVLMVVFGKKKRR